MQGNERGMLRFSGLCEDRSRMRKRARHEFAHALLARVVLERNLTVPLVHRGASIGRWAVIS
jgi:hypothetical protein